MGSGRIWGPKTYRAMGPHLWGVGLWGQSGYGATRDIGPWGPNLWGHGGPQLWGHVGYGATKGIGPWGHVGFGAMGTDRYRAIKGIGPWGDTDMGWRDIGPQKV